MALDFTPPLIPGQEIPNGPFYWPEGWTLQSGLGTLIVGTGLGVDARTGSLINTAGGAGVISVAVASTTLNVTGSPITREGTINIEAPIGSALRAGLLKAGVTGSNINVQLDGTISVPEGNTVTPGVVQLYNATNSPDATLAATAGAVYNLQQQINALIPGSTQVFGGTLNAQTGNVIDVTQAGTDRGLVAGSPLPIPNVTNAGVYVVATVASNSYTPPASVTPLVVNVGDQLLMTNTSWILIPTGYAPQPASTTVAGIVELATGLETATGQDNTRAITPFGLANSGLLDYTLAIEDNGVNIGRANALNFTGAGISVSVAGNLATISVDTTPAGNTYDVQFNLGGVLGASDQFQYNPNINVLTVPTITSPANLVITAPALVGPGTAEPILIRGGAAPDGDAGTVEIQGGASSTGNGTGGEVSISGGIGTTGGGVYVQGGDSTDDAEAGGSVYVQGGPHEGLSGAGGNVYISGGRPNNTGNGNGGSVIISSEDGAGTGTRGSVELYDISVASAKAAYAPTNSNDLATKGYVDQAGVPKLDGDIFRIGDGAPAAGLGVNGDFYVSTPGYDLYYKKGANWVNQYTDPLEFGLTSHTQYTAYTITNDLTLDSLLDFYGNPYIQNPDVTNILNDPAVTTTVVINTATNIIRLLFQSLTSVQLSTLNTYFYIGSNLAGDTLGTNHWDSSVTNVDATVDSFEITSRLFLTSDTDTILTGTSTIVDPVNPDLRVVTNPTGLFTLGVGTSFDNSNRMLVKAPNNTRWIPGPSITNFLTAGPGASVSYDALAGQWTVSATGIAGVESVTGIEPITVDDLDPANPVIGLNTPSITRYSSTAYVNAGYTTIQEVIDANAAGTIFIASGSYTGDVSLTTSKFLSGPPVPTYTSAVGIYGNLSISGATTQYAVLNDLRFYGGNLTISGTVGDHSFSNVTIDGTTTITNGASNTGTTYFENCNLRAVSISADFAGVLFFKGCNFGGQLITNNASALQVYLSDCTGVNTSQTNVTFRGNNANPLAQVALTADTATFSSAITPSPVDPLTQQAAAIDNTTGALISVDNFDGGTF